MVDTKDLIGHILDILQTLRWQLDIDFFYPGLRLVWTGKMHWILETLLLCHFLDVYLMMHRELHGLLKSGGKKKKKH